MGSVENRLEERFVAAREVCRITGLSRSTLWRYEKTGNFPRHRQLGPGRVAWLLSEVLDWIEGRQVVAA